MKRIVRFLSEASCLRGGKHKLPAKPASGTYIRQSVRTAAAIAGIVLMLTFFKTEIHENVVLLSVGGITAGELVENDDGDGVKMAIVCSEDEWAEPEAVRLSEKISAAFDFYPEVIENGRFREADYKNYDLTVVLGHTELSSACYIDEYSRLGEDGYEISPTDVDGRTVAVNLLAFSEKGVRCASDRFIGYFLEEDRLLRSPDTLYVSNCDAESAVPAVIGCDSADVLSVSVPGSDAYSLRALDALLVKTSPALVVFNGGLDCGAPDRSGASEAWSAITSVLDSHNVKYACTFSAADETSPVGADVLYEVVSSFPGYVPETAGGEARTFEDCRLIVLEDGENVKKTALFLINGLAASEDRCGVSEGVLDAYAGILGRSNLRGLPVQIVCAGIPEEAAKAIPTGNSCERDGTFTNNESMETYVFESAKAIVSRIPVNENGCIICSAGNTNVGAGSVILYDVKAPLALTGSLDFLSSGLGGRFELNNSLRGGVLSSLAADGRCSVSYVYAADLGVTGR